MVVQYITLKAVTHDEFDDSFWDEDGIEVDVEENVLDAWNDIQSDYFNFSLEKYDREIFSTILKDIEQHEKEGIKDLPISRVKYYLEVIQNDLGY